MSKVELQAHRGVSSDYPENTMSAFKASICQNYDIIELDLGVTKDGKIVVLHDDTINRTGRYSDGTPIEKEININDITYAETLSYDFGCWFSNKFKGERIPLLSDVLPFAKENGIRLKIDNKFQGFSAEDKKALFDMTREYSSICGYTVNTLEYANLISEKLPDCYIHYDGTVTEEILKELSYIIPSQQLTVWLPFKTKHNTWVQTGFATKEKCELVKKYARLGLWILSEYSDFELACEWGADVIETTGAIKPVLRKGIVPDTHIHSEYSHDSVCPIRDIKDSAKRKNVDIVCITDHCDIGFSDEIDVKQIALNSIRDAKNNNTCTDIPHSINAGVEIGEAFWSFEETEKIIAIEGLDQVVGSVHAVRYAGYTQPYSKIDFSKMDIDTVKDYLSAYFDDVITLIKTADFDILPHLTCPLRYINGKYGTGIDCKEYKDKIEVILSMIIERGIALEINTSCKNNNYDEYMPEEWIIKRYREMGGHLITCGSDAHISENIAYCFNDLFELLKAIGFKYICYFKNRDIYQCTL